MLGAFFTAWIVVGVMTLTGSTMSWYSLPHVLMGLYGLPSLGMALFVFLQVSAAQERALKSSFLMERVQFEGAKLNLTLIVLLTYMYGIRSNVLLLLWLTSAIFGRWFLDKIYQRKRIGNERDFFYSSISDRIFFFVRSNNVLISSVHDRWRLAPTSFFLIRRSYFTNSLPFGQRCNFF
jgi:hypothetical protein